MSREKQRKREQKKQALTIAALVTTAATICIGFAFSEANVGTPWMLGSMGLFYGVLASFTVAGLRKRGEIDKELRPRSGDLTLGGLLAALLYGVAMAVHILVTSPPSPRSAWIIRLYAALGDPASEEHHFVGGIVFVVAALEEFVWRGLVMRTLQRSFGWLRAWLSQAVLFSISHIPTMFLLGDPRVGPNPLLVAAGIAYSLVWGRLALRMDRLPPAIFAHALFTWAAFEFPIWRP